MALLNSIARAFFVASILLGAAKNFGRFEAACQHAVAVFEMSQTTASVGLGGGLVLQILLAPMLALGSIAPRAVMLGAFLVLATAQLSVSMFVCERGFDVLAKSLLCTSTLVLNAAHFASASARNARIDVPSVGRLLDLHSALKQVASRVRFAVVVPLLVAIYIGVGGLSHAELDLSLNLGAFMCHTAAFDQKSLGPLANALCVNVAVGSLRVAFYVCAKGSEGLQRVQRYGEGAYRFVEGVRKRLRRLRRSGDKQI